LPGRTIRNRLDLHTGGCGVPPRKQPESCRFDADLKMPAGTSIVPI
jgi:hypothetical protein